MGERLACDSLRAGQAEHASFVTFTPLSGVPRINIHRSANSRGYGILRVSLDMPVPDTESLIAGTRTCSIKNHIHQKNIQFLYDTYIRKAVFVRRRAVIRV